MFYDKIFKKASYQGRDDLASKNQMKNNSARATTKRIFGLMKPYWYLIVLCLIFGEGIQLFSAYEPIFTQSIIDSIFVQQQYQALHSLLLWLMAAVVGAVLLDAIRDIFMAMLAQYTMSDMRRSLLFSLQKKTFAFFDRNKVGKLVSNMTVDVEATGQFLGRWVEDIVEMLMGIATILFLMHGRSPQMTAVAFLPILLIFFITWRISTMTRPVMKEQQNLLGAIAIKIQQNIFGMKVIRTFQQEEEATDFYREDGKKYLKNAIYVGKLTAMNTAIGSYILATTVAVIYIYGANLVLSPTSPFTVGELFMFAMYVTKLVTPTRRLSNGIITYTQALAGAERVFAVLDEEPDVKDKPNAKDLQYVEGEIRFEHVDFEYLPGRPVLKDVNFAAEAGETIAILGPTGSGKSTLIYLLPRFYDVFGGRILIDGTDVRDVTLKSLRRQVGVVLQEIFLFTGTIRYNISFGRPNATQAEIENAAKLAKAHDFIMSFPEGYDTIVGERGVTLSGGQKQRIAIARTLLTDPRILILDDSMSYVDAKTEQDIQQALLAVMKGRTTFVIAQRLSTIKNANRIMVLKDGQIAEMGTHQELVALNGLYKRIYEAQFEALTEMPPIYEARSIDRGTQRRQDKQ